MKGFITAIRTLTVIPFPGDESDDFSEALPWFSAVGFIIGMVLFLFSALWNVLPFDKWTWGCAAVIAVLSIWLTRGLHTDGLADWADSLGGFGRERRLAIMKDSSSGAFGVIAIVLVILLKVIAFERILSSGTFYFVIAVPVISRCMLVELQSTMPYARSEEGMAGVFIKNAKEHHRAIAHVSAVVFSFVLGLAGPVLYLSAFAVTMIMKGMFRRQFNGITGDLLGATNEIIEVVLLMMIAIPGAVLV